MMILETTHELNGKVIEADYEVLGLRGRAKMITFIKRDGTRFAASYSHLHGIHLIAGGLRLEFTRCSVVVQGERLSSVHHALADHRVSFLRESPIDGADDLEKAQIRKIILAGFAGAGMPKT